jgi:hypothetical protein
VVAIYTFWGPPWPTEPSFDPGFPSFGLPLDVPFSVANKSAIFPISDLTILCGLEYFEGKNRRSIFPQQRRQLGDVGDNPRDDEAGAGRSFENGPKSGPCLLEFNFFRAHNKF